MQYIINDIPPSNNQFIGRTNRYEYQGVKKQWAAMIRYCCNPKPREPMHKCRVHLHYEFADRRRRDPDNYSGKMILDGLVRSGIISDDSFGCIDLVLSASFGKLEKRTIITVEELT